MIFNTRDTVIIDKIEYICYREEQSFAKIEHLGILIQDFIRDDEIKEIVRIVEHEHEYVFLGIEIKNSEAYLLFTKDLSKWVKNFLKIFF